MSCSLISTFLQLQHLLYCAYITNIIGHNPHKYFIDFINKETIIPYCSKYSCNTSQSMILFYFLRKKVPYDSQQKINLFQLRDNILTDKYNQFTLLAFSIFFEYTDDQEEYIHHYSILTSNNSFILIHTFGEKFDFEVFQMTKNEFIYFIDCLIIMYSDEPIKNINEIKTCINKYFNHETIIINDCITNKTNKLDILENIKNMGITITEYTKDFLITNCFTKLKFDVDLFLNKYFGQIVNMIQEGNKSIRLRKLLNEISLYKYNNDKLVDNNIVGLQNFTFGDISLQHLTLEPNYDKFVSITDLFKQIYKQKEQIHIIASGEYVDYYGKIIHYDGQTYYITIENGVIGFYGSDQVTLMGRQHGGSRIGVKKVIRIKR